MNKEKINILDITLRDGSHAVSHSFTVEQARTLASRLDGTGVRFIEISHGDGIAGSSINYGFSKCPELELVKAAKSVIKNTEIDVLLLPGVGTIADLEKAREAGATAVRVATHVTEADVGIQHIKYGKSAGMFVAGFLMMVHMVSPEKILEQARIFEDCGVDYVNLADSAGYLTPDGVRERVGLLREKLSVPVGFHAHNNLGLALANSLVAVESGATYLDGTCRGLGAGAGNAQIEVLSAILDRLGYNTGMDIYKIMDVAEEVVEPLMHRPQTINTASLMLGYAGVYSSFLLHTYRAAERFNVNPRDILVELGTRKMVGGQEDMIVDVAFALSQSSKN